MSAPPKGTSRDPRGRLRSVLGLLALAGGFVSFASHYVRHLTNNMWSDLEFSGWTSALAHRVVEGAVPFRDLVLPIPPGSLWVLAAIERATGRSASLHEAAVCAACHLLMALLAYAIAAPFASRLDALFVAAGSLAVVLQLPKELAYDHTAQVFSWASLALLAPALARWSRGGRAPLALVAGAGALAGLGSLFKQSTSTGAIVGGGLALLFLAVARRREAKGAVPALVTFAASAALGVGVTLALVTLAGGSAASFVQVVYLDGSKLKGGLRVLGPRMLGYATSEPTVQLPLLVAAFGALVARGITTRSERPRLDDETPGAAPSWRALLLFAAIVVGVCAAGVAMFVGHFKSVGVFGIPHAVGRWLPFLGLALAVGAAVGSLVRRASTDPRRHAFTALVLAALVGATFHNASVPEVRFFYDNNPITAVALTALFVATTHARRPALRWLAFATLFSAMLGGKMQRWLDARTPVRDGSFWAGMYVSERGNEIVRAAARVREITAPDDRVLVLPEDVSFAMLVGRPRPSYCGAILFVDQYPERCLASDLQAFESDPPKVVVVYPAHEDEWQRMYHIWADGSPAGLFNHAVLHWHLPNAYRLDSTYESRFWNAPSPLEVYVRRDELRERPRLEPIE